MRITRSGTKNFVLGTFNQINGRADKLSLYFSYNQIKRSNMLHLKNIGCQKYFFQQRTSQQCSTHTGQTLKVSTSRVCHFSHQVSVEYFNLLPHFSQFQHLQTGLHLHQGSLSFILLNVETAKA